MNDINYNSDSSLYFDVAMKTKEFYDKFKANGKGKRPEWIGDSGATRHMTFDQTRFKNMKPLNGHYVQIGNGKLLTAKGQGDILVKNRTGRVIKLHNVLYVPDLHCNLFSIRVCQKEGNTITFPGSKPKFLFVQAKNGTRLMTGSIGIGNLYVLDILGCSVERAKVSAAIWHQRMGHVSTARMKRIKNWSSNINFQYDGKLEIKHTTPCFGCSKGKLKRRRRKTDRIHKAK